MIYFKKHTFTVLGVLYVAFAILTAMAAIGSATVNGKESQLYRDIQQGTQHLKQDARPKITVWSSRYCSWCRKFKKEIPRLKKMGYKVTERSIDNEPRPKQVKGVPTSIVTYKGKIVIVIVGYKTAEEVDKIIQNATNRFYFGWISSRVYIDINIFGKNYTPAAR